MTIFSLKHMQRKLSVLLRRAWFLIALMAFLLIAISLYVSGFLAQTIKIETSQVFQIQPGESAGVVIRNLQREIAIDRVFASKIWFRLDPDNAEFKAGIYDIEPEQKLQSLLQRFQQGKTKQLQIRLVEGQTWQVWLTQLQNTQWLRDDLNTQELLDQFQQQSGWEMSSMEGILMPDTYRVEAGSNASDIVRKAFDNMVRFVETEWRIRDVDLPLANQYQALILASIIEKETGLSSERAHIASVFINRLNVGMRLQTDPTVIYGLGDEFTGNLTKAHLRQKTAYNTYRINGLPPTPIAMVGKAAILASLHPIFSDDLYFVARGDGSHQFSTTLKQHNAAVRQYQLGKK